MEDQELVLLSETGGHSDEDEHKMCWWSAQEVFHAQTLADQYRTLVGVEEACWRLQLPMEAVLVTAELLDLAEA